MDASSSPPPRFLTFLLLVIGLAGLGVGLWLAWSARQATATGLRVPGTVVGLVEVKGKAPPPGKQSKVANNPNRPSLAPQVEYVVDGQTYRIRGTVSSTIPGYSHGDRVTVRYPPDRPAEGTIDSFAETWLAPLLVVGVSLLFTLVGVGLTVARRRASVNEPSALEE
jgi:hypothetical protein